MSANKIKAGVVGVRPKGRKRINAMTEAVRQKLPPIPDNMRPEIDAAREVHKTRKASPGARVYTRPDGSWFIDAPYRDLEAWEVAICEAFGTRSASVMWTFLDQLSGLCAQSHSKNSKGEFVDWKPSEMELSAILGILHSEQPETPLQCAMLAQMIANHFMQMRVASGILRFGGDYIAPDKAQTFAKLTNAFANQAEVYQKLRGKAPAPKELIVRHVKEVHLWHHRGADIIPPSPTSGGIGSQSLEASEFTDAEYSVRADSDAAREPEGGPALPGPNAPGVVVPMRRPEGPTQVQTPRRASRGSKG